MTDPAAPSDAVRAAPTAEYAPEYSEWVERVANALHENCKLEWQAIAVTDPSRQVTMHQADAHYAQAHDLVRRLHLANRAALRLPAAAPVDVERLAAALKAEKAVRGTADRYGSFNDAYWDQFAAAILNRLAGQSSSQPVGGDGND
jgi:hypothetical protein